MVERYAPGTRRVFDRGSRRLTVADESPAQGLPALVSNSGATFQPNGSQQ
jgi:hypothetical protein